MKGEKMSYNELFWLSYFNPIKMHMNHPMHNLMLGVAEHVFKMWVKLGYLNNVCLMNK